MRSGKGQVGCALQGSFGKAVPVALAGLKEPAEGEYPVPRVLLRYSHPKGKYMA